MLGTESIVEQESLLIIKTKASVLSEVIALPIIGGNEDYLKWVIEEVRGW